MTATSLISQAHAPEVPIMFRKGQQEKIRRVFWGSALWNPSYFHVQGLTREKAEQTPLLLHFVLRTIQVFDIANTHVKFHC